MAVKERRSARSAAPRRYPLTDSFFNESIREAIRESLFSPISLGERHNVKLKPNFDTACWAYLPPHNIYIGKDLFEKASLKVGLSEELKRKYIGNHYHHELAHALFTERNMRSIQKALKAIDAPFGTYNLFEDALIEDRYRKEAEYAFEWLTMEELNFNPRPESLLFALIQAEGNVSVVEAALKSWKPEAPEVPKDDPLAAFALLFKPDPKETVEALLKLLPRVLHYYHRIIAVKESLHLMPLLNAWLDEFGRPPQMPPNAPGAGAADLELSAKLMTDEQEAEQFDSESTTVMGDTDVSPEDPLKEGKSGKATADESYQAVSSRGTVLHRNSTPVDMNRAQALATKLAKLFEAKSRMVSTQTPQRRISARHFAIGRAPYRRVELTGRGRKEVFLEIDCSGSMGGFHIMEGKVLITALSLLAKRGYVSGHVALSAVVGGPSWELFKLPLAQEVINRIQGYAGAEGLEYTLKDNMKLLQKADYVFVYTDAQICDRPIDKALFHRHGVYTWGLYAGQHGNYLEELMKYFDKAIMRDNAEALVDAMLTQSR